MAVFAPVAARAQLEAFEGAEGFGQYATGARTNLSAATVYHVTNLNDSGPGSFRDAVSQPNRFVVFDVSGIINIDSAVVVQDNVTIAGQTSPGGIAVYGNKVSYSGANNTITRYMAYRLGTAVGREDASGASNGSNMMFDHMSITWGVDETFSFNWDGKGNSLDNITIQNSIIGQGLDVVGHSAGGLMTFPEGGRFSIIQSLFTDSVTRNPKVRGENEFINNVVYGWETAGYIMGDTTNMDSHANVIGNYFIEGPVNGGGPFSSGTANFHIYASDNWVDTDRDGVLDGSLVTSYPGADVVANPFNFPTTTAMSAQDALQYVMENAGVSIIRDAVDTRIMQEVASYGTLGGVIVRESDLFPGYGTDPQYVITRARFTDADNDGIADNWEAAHGLSASSGSDWKNLSAAGYTQLEEYINELGAEGETILSSGGNWSNTSTWNGAAPTLADDVVVVGNLTLSSGNAFARTLSLGGNLNMSGGTLDVFDTATVASGDVTISGGTATFGQLLLASSGQNASLTLGTGATMQIATVASNGGNATLNWNGGMIRATGTPTVSIDTVLGAAGGTFDTNGYSGVYSGQITGSGALTKIGGGTLTLSGNNAYTGGTTLTGRLKLAHNNAAGTGAITITSSGGTVELGNGVTVNNDLFTNYSFEILDVAENNASATFAGDISTVGGSQLRLQTTGNNATLNLTGAVNAGSSFFILKTGNVVLRSSGSITAGPAIIGRDGSTTSLTVRDNAGFNSTSLSIGGGKALNSGTITVRDNATFSIGAATFDLLSTSTGTSFSEFNLDGGTTTVGGFAKGSTGSTQTSEIDFNGGTLRYGGSAANANFLSALTGLTANVQTGGARIDGNGQAITIAQSLVHDAALATPDGGLTKLGNGTLTLAATNTYNGATTINGGTLSVAALANGGSNSGIGSSSNAAANLVLNGGTLRYTGAATNSDRAFTLGGNGGGIEASGSGTLNLNGGEAVVLTGSGDRTLTLGGSNAGFNNFHLGLGDAAAGKTSLAKEGSGTWRLFGNMSYSGDTNVNGGTLYLIFDNRLPSGAGMGDLNIAAGAKVDMYGAHQTVNGLNGGGTVTTTLNSGRTLTVGAGDADGDFSGKLTQGASQTLAFKKIGNGTQVLSGNGNDYTGATTVEAGTLIVNGTTGTGLTTVQNGAALGGSGVIAGGLLAQGSVGPGNSPGTLTIESTATFGDGSVLTMELAGPSEFDRLVVNGTLNLQAGSTLEILLTGLDPEAGQSFDLIDWQTLAGQFTTILLPDLPEGLTFDTSALYTTGALSIAAAPEPTTASLLALAACASVLRRRR